MASGPPVPGARVRPAKQMGGRWPWAAGGPGGQEAWLGRSPQTLHPRGGACGAPSPWPRGLPTSSCASQGGTGRVGPGAGREGGPRGAAAPGTAPGARVSGSVFTRRGAGRGGRTPRSFSSRGPRPGCAREEEAGETRTKDGETRRRETQDHPTRGSPLHTRRPRTGRFPGAPGAPPLSALSRAPVAGLGGPRWGARGAYRSTPPSGTWGTWAWRRRRRRGRTDGRREPGGARTGWVPRGARLSGNLGPRLWEVRPSRPAPQFWAGTQGPRLQVGGRRKVSRVRPRPRAGAGLGGADR